VTKTSADLHVLVDGPVDAPPLVLGPSLGTTASIWDPLLPALTRSFRVIRYDLRGHGDTPATRAPAPCTIADLGGDVLRALDRLGVERASYAGVSLGGMIGMWLAACAPARVDRLALVCTAAFLPPADRWRERAATVRAEGTGALADALVGRWFTPAFVARRGDLVARVVADLHAVDREEYASCCEAIASWDWRDRLGDVRAPTLVVAGAEDPVTPPADAYALGAAIPDAQVTVVKGAAHLAILEKPDTLAGLLLAHLGERAHESETEPADEHRANRGERVRRAVLGDAHVDRARRSASAFAAPFQDLVNRFPWGDIWARPGLSRAERSIATLAALAVLCHERELEMHAVAALRNGLTVEQIREVLLHAGAYGGIPVAYRALSAAERALRDAGALDAKPPGTEDPP
jgi:3-oxoadipate enol-lactonase/4-carboxymuconolactone decarboxylase